MHRAASKRVTRSSGSGLKQINVECGGEVNPTVDNVSEHGKTSEAGSHMPNEAKLENGHLHHEIMENGKGIEEQKPTPQTGKKISNTKNKFSGSHRELVIGLPCRGQFEIHQSRSSTSSKRLGGGGERNILFSSHKRALRSKEAAGSSSVAANNTLVGRPKIKNKTMKKGEVREDDEYTRIKKKLRYFLNRINYEQNLIDAYSLEGWKGSSLEKLRPEKELERATKEILRRKLKIRDLFQHLDTLCAEGSLPESLFDSDGEISSEDIFCAKCGLKDLSVDNDIILCDGFCDRGFHQYCLEPPLRKEDIPPDDEGWLCPGCDCKDDSLDLLNDSLGTKLSVSDSWEKIFPEAAAALAGGDQNLNCDLPSDDSDDEEYDPDGLNNSDDNEESENQDGSSDESDFTSASDEMIESFKEGKDIMKDIMALPSDDSEDDDYDPEALTRDEDEIQESSNSDCTSNSEDIETSFKGNESKHEDEDTPLEDLGRKKSHLPYDAISESDAVLDDGLAGVPRRQNVERLNYKKLYDEEYENVPSSSSDDDDWDKTARMGKENSESEDEGGTVPLKQSSNVEDHTSKKRRRKSKRADKTDTLEVPQQGPGENGCSGEKNNSSAYKQKDPKTQRLYLSFQENRYPDKATKESLAKELQMTITQVNNWFKNRRSSINSKPVVSEEDVEKSKTGKEGECETSVAGSSKHTMETESVAENRSVASESTNPGSRKRRRR